jgi:hypothetical protein
MKYFVYIILLTTLINCGSQITIPPRSGVEGSDCSEYVSGICVYVPKYNEHSFCEYYLGGICIMQDRFMEIDKETLVWSIFITEEHVNTFYPGLNLFELGEQEGLKIQYLWAGNNQHAGTYNEKETKARVWLRSGDTITDRMECMDRYFVTMHELLHFVHFRHMYYEYTGDSHIEIPHLFTRWETQQAFIEGRMYDWTNTAEGLIYYDITNKCGYGGISDSYSGDH